MTTQTLDQEQQRQAVSVDAERRALGACLMATPAYDPVADVVHAVREGEWYEPAHQLVWSAVQRLHGQGRPTGLPAVEAELRSTGSLERVGGPAGLAQIASDACSPAEAGHYADLVHGYAQVRRFQEALVRGMQGARIADPLSVPHTIAAHQAELEYLCADDQDDDTFGRFGDHLDAHLDSLAVSVPPSAVTGFTDLDSLVKLMPGQMILVAARPAMGKSAFALGVATANARRQGPTLVHSLEMGRAEVSNRILSARARVAFHHIRDGVDSLTQDDWDRLDQHTPELRDLPLWMDYSARVSPARIRSRIKTVTRETGRAPLVIVDYLQLMQTDQRNSRQSPYERVTEISRELKILASDTGAVIIALAQLNRGPEQRQDKRPQVGDLRDSGALEQDADSIILLHRQDYYEPESGRAGETDLIVAKHRNGPTATVTVAHQFHYSRLRDMSGAEEPAL
ncbi:replicative DNA helicase [Streptomyces collinus]|uniref:replicative DNA helicase n=1 Tax=Streptomyces collinus TaxID=42684 RepID=UPI003426558D